MTHLSAFLLMILGKSINADKGRSVCGKQGVEREAEGRVRLSNKTQEKVFLGKMR